MLVKTIDIDKLWEFEQNCFSRPYSISILTDVIKTHVCYYICHQEIVVGYLIALKIDNGYELIRIGVLTQYRKQSFAKSALLEFINIHQTDIHLEVSDKNFAAIKLYESLDFKQIHIRNNYYHDGNNAIVMVRHYRINQ